MKHTSLDTFRIVSFHLEGLAWIDWQISIFSTLISKVQTFLDALFAELSNVQV